MYFKVTSILTIVAILSVSIYGQSMVLVGSVADKVGGEIPGVKITLKSVSGEKHTATTDNKGDLSVDLGAGIYTVEFKSYGFERRVVRKYVINKTEDGKPQRLDVRMEVRPLVRTDD